MFYVFDLEFYPQCDKRSATHTPSFRYRSIRLRCRARPAIDIILSSVWPDRRREAATENDLRERDLCNAEPDLARIGRFRPCEAPVDRRGRSRYPLAMTTRFLIRWIDGRIIGPVV